MATHWSGYVGSLIFKLPVHVGVSWKHACEANRSVPWAKFFEGKTLQETYVAGTVEGLRSGAPVLLRGVPVGEGTRSISPGMFTTFKSLG